VTATASVNNSIAAAECGAEARSLTVTATDRSRLALNRRHATPPATFPHAARNRRRTGVAIPMELATMRHRLWSITLSGMLSGLTLAAGLPPLAPAPAAAQQMQMMPPSQADLIRGLLPTVVNITSFVTDTPATAAMNAANVPANLDGAHPKTVQGSGFVIDPSGVILTNSHVIAGAYDVQVMFSDGEHVPARILATSPRIDLALIKVDTRRPLTSVRWADSDKVQVADPVFAIGNPLGVGLSVSSGIVSALNRNLMDTPLSCCRLK
jgi:S1-C subfamily serine protease